jgi:uncharacterized protein YecE (DUF72 family)
MVRERWSPGVSAVRVGTSGWSYDDWDGRFYPHDLAQRSWFEHYAATFPTVEINYSFYRLPRASTVETWHDRAPRRFRYAVKGSRYITHNLKIGDAGDAVGNVTERMAPLKSFLGVWLWQLPPNLKRDVDRLDAFLGQLPGGQRHAVEFRERTWWDDEVYETLASHGAALVWLSDPEMPRATPRTADLVYVRFHGLGEERYRYDYTDDELEPWAELLADAAGDGCDAYAFFNNDHEARAPANAQRLVEMLGDTALDWP